MLTILVNIEPVVYSRSFASWRIWIHMIWSIWTVRCRSSIVIWMSPISIIVIWMPPISWCISAIGILLSPSSPPYHHCCPMVVNSCQSMLQSIVVKFLHGYLLLAWSPILRCCSHTQVSNRKQGMQIPFCNFPMQVPMQISNANFLCNFQCKFPMQFPMQISNAIPNANFQCKFPM